MLKKFYVTTPIYYPSGQLHLGHAYTTTLADVLKRYKRMQGFETFFLTGADEHGQKIEKKALEVQQDVLSYLDDKVANFKVLWEKLNIDYDQFLRTTESFHVHAVQQIFSQLLEKGYIYKGNYQGLYCVSCEEFLTSDQLNAENLCKVSLTKPEKIVEETYFLRTSNFTDFVTELMHTDFLQPSYHRTEILKNFLEPGLKDLSITRVSFKWGIPITENPQHVVYVWLDALTNYITALGYTQKNAANFQKFWADDQTEILQLVGKEITRFHAVYWPIILKTLDLRLPNTLLAHGWILNKDSKMSKSLGNTVDPLVLIADYGADALRFYIAHDLPTDRDGVFTTTLLIESFNTHLANNLGNLISRVHNMIEKYFDGLLPDIQNVDPELIAQGTTTLNQYTDLMDQYRISDAMKAVLNLGGSLNKYIEVHEPWTLAKNEQYDQLAKVLGSLQRNIVIMCYLFKPVLTEKYPDMLEQLGVQDTDLSFTNLQTFSMVPVQKLGPKKVLFQRIKN